MECGRTRYFKHQRGRNGDVQVCLGICTRRHHRQDKFVAGDNGSCADGSSQGWSCPVSDDDMPMHVQMGLVDCIAVEDMLQLMSSMSATLQYTGQGLVYFHCGWVR
jgi:hypothetical protein